MSTYDLLLYLLKQHYNKVSVQRIEKSVLDPMGTSPMEKCKLFEHDFPHLALLIYSNLPGEAQLAFAHISMGNPLLGIAILYIPLVVNPNSLIVCGIDINVIFSDKAATTKAPYTDSILN